MADYAPRRGQDLNQLYSDTNLSLTPYLDGHTNGYLNGNAHIHYSHTGSTYPSYSPVYSPSHNGTNGLMFMSPLSSFTMNYSNYPTRPAMLPTQSINGPPGSYYGSNVNAHPHLQQSARYQDPHDFSLVDTEDQESANQDTMRSEPVLPALEGYPNVDEFDQLMLNYVSNLSPKKQDKALIHAKRAANIRAVLLDKKTTSIETAQFRFWVKKMFTLEPSDPSMSCRKRKICHEHKPVAIREKLFKILTRAHKMCQHGGRDKTSAQVRKVYSWVPKELISQFVKLCPTCQVRRGTGRGSPPESERSMDNYMNTQASTRSSPTDSRRASVTTTSSTVQSPINMAGFSATFQQQNRWMTPATHAEQTSDFVPRLEHPPPLMNQMHHPSRANGNMLPSVRMARYPTGTDHMLGIETTVPSYYSTGPSAMHGYQGSELHYRFKQEPRENPTKRY